MENKSELHLKFTDSEMFHTFIYAGDLKLLYFLMVLMLIDIITGLAKAFKNKDLWSYQSMYGFGRKILVFCIIILANIIDQILNLNSGLLMITIFYYIANEGLSIVENCAEMGILIPDEIGEKLKVIRNNDKGDKHE